MCQTIGMVNNEIILNNSGYQNLIQNISKILHQKRVQAYTSVNISQLEAYWTIGQYIVEFEQHGTKKAEYGSSLLINLSNDLTTKFGRGFSKSNLFNMRLFYITFPKFQTVSGKLSWSHYVELISIKNEIERNFYIKETLSNNWSIRDLKRQINTGLFLRLANTKDASEIIKLSQSGQIANQARDIIKDTYILEFLDLPDVKYSENKLEEALITKLQEFLLEIGKGFAFVGRQYKLTVNNTNLYADLVFYNINLHCYVIIDLKIGKVNHADIGQMNTYLGYFALDKTQVGDNPPIGIILTANKDDVFVEYATHGITNQLFVSQYQMYLPDIKELRRIMLSKIDEFNIKHQK
jgi:predicted nuclease of restriction endonuclease-like (RecB) superfamily